MTDYADLEIGLHAREGTTWRVELRYSEPTSDVDTRLDSRGPQFVLIDPDALRAHAEDDEAYGEALGEALFAGGVAESYRQAKVAAHKDDITLRVRLFVGPSAAPLHAVRWETLRDPDDGSPLLTDESIVFSRYLSSNDWRPVGLRPMSRLRPVALVANPSDVREFGQGEGLAPLDVEQEVTTARDGMLPLAARVLAGKGEATQERLFEELREGCDILYLVCHGYLAGGEPVLLLEDEEQHGAPMRGIELVERLRDLVRMPRLVVLASCQSAGRGEESHSDDGGVLAALGPRLAEAGVPAVIAMQGNISMPTISRFMPIFFRELQRDGQVDRAMAAARGTVRDRPDWWVPVLFMRLRSGRIWYVPGFGRKDFEKFPALINEIRDQKCTPILGPGINDQLLGSRQEIAQRWAKHFHFPMAPHWRDDLPQVAQFLSVNQSQKFPRDELANYLRNALLENYGELLPESYRARSRSDIPLGPLMSEAWRIRYPKGSEDPYAFLAELPLTLYVTTQPWGLLAEALRDAGKDPQVELCRWKRLENDDPWGSDTDFDTPDWAFATFDDPGTRRQAAQAGWPTSVFDREPSYRPSEQRPLVFHLFGHHARVRSLVLTEDDYFDFLIGITRDRDLVPVGVRKAFADSSLMLLGQPELGFDTRVVYRSIVNQEGNRRAEHTHVAVQIDPEEGRSVEPDRARRYLETYFQSSNFTIYWGSTEGFIKELRDNWVASS